LGALDRIWLDSFSEDWEYCAAEGDKLTMDIQGSVGKILQRGEALANLFYNNLLIRHPQLLAYFEGVNLQRQAVLLTMSLKLIEQHYVHRYPAMRSYLKLLGHRHQDRFRIPPDMFSPFGDCLLATIQEFHGSEWDQGLDDQWRAAIHQAIAVMLEDSRPSGELKVSVHFSGELKVSVHFSEGQMN
jgi:hemoglobin-like flavoprotein